VAAGTVLVGAQNSMQLTGLPPGQPVDLEARVPGDDDWQTVAQSTASAAGTGRFDFTVPATADYRVVSGDAVSVPTRVVAAVAPAPPVDVTATPSGPGQLTVSWGPPPSDGGSPLTRYVVEVNGVRAVAPPTATSLVVSGVVAGPRAVSVRAANLVATSAPTATTVDVPAYPSVAAPAAVRKGSTVTLRARGLVPGAPASVLVTPAKGAPVTRALTVGPAGTAALRLVVKASVTVAVTSGELTSAPRAVRTR
jgi:hypothetical protein